MNYLNMDIWIYGDKRQMGKNKTNFLILTLIAFIHTLIIQ